MKPEVGLTTTTVGSSTIIISFESFYFLIYGMYGKAITTILSFHKAPFYVFAQTLRITTLWFI